MNKEEFVKKAKELGYTEDMINEIIYNHENAEKEQIKIPWELELIELPVED